MYLQAATAPIVIGLFYLYLRDCYEKEPWKERNLRIMPVDNYLVFYIPRSEEKTVTVIRVMYGRRDIDAQLKQTLSEN